MDKKEIRVVELFAGVGGFRVGLEQCSKELFRTVWANQWEPGQRGQWAFKCYQKHFGDEAHCVNADIATVTGEVPDHDLLVGGFPCQDYSVANASAQGIEGKKGVLWWSIYDIIQKKHPPYILLENVDRLLKSPSKQRGRDFGIILRCLSDEGYNVEWRVINAADYGFPQRRRRVFIFASSQEHPHIELHEEYEEKSLFEKCFPSVPCDGKRKSCIVIDGTGDLVYVSQNFSEQFYNSGIMIRGLVSTFERAVNSTPPPANA